MKKRLMFLFSLLSIGSLGAVNGQDDCNLKNDCNFNGKGSFVKQENGKNNRLITIDELFPSSDVKCKTCGKTMRVFKDEEYEKECDYCGSLLFEPTKTMVKSSLTQIIDGVSYPLIGCKVELWDNIDNLIDVSKTNSLGRIKFKFETSKLGTTFSRCKIIAYAGDDNVIVMNQNRTLYKLKGDFTSINKGKVNNFNGFSVTVDIGGGNSQNNAFYVGQAALRAKEFAEDMMGREPDPVDLFYPALYSSQNSTVSYYRSNILGNNSINITRGFYNNNFDTVMHEYGHHVQSQLGFSYFHLNIFSHEFDVKLKGYINSEGHKYSTSEANKLAWAESWPTVFGQIAQKYSISKCREIPNPGIGLSNGSAYREWIYGDSIFNLDYDLENSRMYNGYQGEDCEYTIAGVLWDVFDTYSTSDADQDNIAFTYKGWFDITTSGKYSTFKDFYKGFTTTYSYLKTNFTNLLIGKNISY